jgi:hypothetical protein
MSNSLTRIGSQMPNGDWLNSLSPDEQAFVGRCINSTVQFSQGVYKNFFQNCGLYATGSSLSRPQHNDVDIVLVGLDFRAVVDYDKVFLQDPETLIKEKILVEPYHFEVLAKDDETGEPTLLRPMSETDTIEAWSLQGMEHDGVKYDYNFARNAGEALDLRNFCSYRAKPSMLVKNLREHLMKTMRAHADEVYDPFEPYCHQMGCFMTTPFNIYPVDPASISTPRPALPSLPCPPIHFIINTENLHVPAWKAFQGSQNLPYVTLYEWPLVGQVTDRPVLTQERYPEYIDPAGLERPKNNYVFWFTPANEKDVEIDGG